MKRRMRKVPIFAAVMLAMVTVDGPAGAEEIELPFDPANFVPVQDIDNTFFPLIAKTTYVYEAEEDEFIRNVISVTEAKKIVAGVNATVVHDVEWALVEGLGTVKLEETFDWYAQDIFGNVWYFGEDTVAYIYDEAWNLLGSSTEGSWEAGVDGAEPGIIMLANPHPGLSYRQEFYEDVAEDMGKVLRDNATASVLYGDFEGCLKTKEWSPLELGTVEHKFYAPDVGLVLINELTGGKTVRVELVEVIVE